MNTETDTIEGSWFEHMRSGDFESAWKLSDSVLALGLNRDFERMPRHCQSIWDGSSLAGKKVLIRCYHGLGDSIQFIRYAPLVKKLASWVMVWAQPSLIELFKTAKGIDRLLSLHDGVPGVSYDVDIEIMELPFAFRTTVSSIPAEIPYLSAPPLTYPVKGISIGLVWQAGDWNKERNIPFHFLRPLFAIKDVQYVILQENLEKARWSPGLGFYPGKFNLFDYARIIKELDLLISVDSMPCHLAGALNVPVWTMLQKSADWRWMDTRTDSPWYPSMKLFRQERQGDWTHVVERVAEELKMLFD